MGRPSAATMLHAHTIGAHHAWDAHHWTESGEIRRRAFAPSLADTGQIVGQFYSHSEMMSIIGSIEHAGQNLLHDPLELAELVPAGAA